ncbi:transcriptional regulator, IclR family [Beutenbergia cavernae DSM 12333]|uniref:Transcriptional regulator, IclR family n=1 Tax=Beutenbergia cavernae (strain ATCC BAA-8 / DSM 12333 / CCUG 43141 / JCM 11478 / NBRC 16432 / NCIMB 13614 / HKI 0122) TaxID=471853 RepID=C5C538_BEUC1|nr:IclR family transcriptional regulator [Beutenbergia cavernae]ACQ82178.1 transcriptional regulator, IclR family [Beutenbergia cavernae DSM 12333]
MPKQSARETVQGTQSIDRALSLLTAFSAERPRQRISDLVSTTGLGQSTVSRMVAAMTSMGFIRHDPLSGLYSLGPEVVDLAGIVLNDHPVHAAARQIAQNLAASLGLGVNVAERSGQHLFYLCNFEGKDAPRNSTLIGRGGPLHATALGKALLIDSDRASLESLLGATFDRYTARTITTVDALHQEMAAVADRGYAIENEELALRRACLAAPIRGRGGDVVAAVSVSGPLSAMNLAEREDFLAMVLIEQADQISTALGYVARAATTA